MNIALDIDGTITKMPSFFSFLSQCVKRTTGKVLIITSRANDPEVAQSTRRELERYKIEVDELFIVSDDPQQQICCPHEQLDWYQKYLWQKVAICIEYDVQVVFEDDAKVIALFKEYAPDVQVFQVC